MTTGLIEEIASLGNKSSIVNDVVNSDKLTKIGLFVFGYGTVGQELINLICQQQEVLIEFNLILKIFGKANSRTILLDDHGLGRGAIDESHGVLSFENKLEKLKAFVIKHKIKNPVIVDCTGSPEIASKYLTFLESGFHIVTANKIANGDSIQFYQSIRKTAVINRRKFLYETNIGAGLPVIEPLQKLLRSGDQLRCFEGILSGSLSFIFGEINQGVSFSEATLKAKALGFTEPDPREDLNGMDVARKVLIIAREIGLKLELSDVCVEPVVSLEFCENLTVEQFLERLPELDSEFYQLVESAHKENLALKYVANISDNKCHVCIKAVNKQNPLFDVIEGENVLAFHTKYYNPKPLVIRGYGAGPTVTAAGVFSDILRLVN